MPEPSKRAADQPLAGPNHEFIDAGLRVLDTEAQGIGALVAAMQNGLRTSFIEAVEMIRCARGRVVTSGMGKSGHVGHSLAATMSSTGTPAMFVHPAEAGHGDLGMITPDDVIMALSWSGETVELKPLIDYSRRFRIGLIAMTSEAASTLAQAADIALVLPQAREACPHNLAPTTSSLMQLALGHALAIALLESRGFTPLDFRILHPGGRLGAALTFARDLMHAGDAMPLVLHGRRMANAIMEMSTKGFGCVGVVDATGHLVGIVTDGDLRRHMRPDLLDLAVDQVMTARPICAKPDQLASETLQLLNASKITAVFVVERGRPIGVIHLHDLLRAGVA
jgi:arabinose-5-phosphate isomerase